MSVDQLPLEKLLVSNPVSTMETDFEIIVHQAPVGICKMTLDGTILFANKKICNYLNTSLENVVGKSYLDFYRSETNAGYFYWLELLKDGNLPFYNGWIDLTSRTGDIIPCHMNLHQIYDSNSEPLFFLCVFDRFEEEQIIQQQVYEERVSYQQKLSGTIIKAQEKERAFLAEELHDNINQLLATAKLYIDSAKSAKQEQATGLLEKSSEHILTVINELRTLSKSLTPPSIEDTSLVNNIYELFQHMEKLSGVTIEINHTAFNEKKLSHEKKLMIYRIVQEQFNNILKHANATKISLTFKNKNKIIELIVEDNGKGFNANNTPLGLGLKNIRNRAALYNGRVSVQSAPGKGCRLHVEFES